jgi:hypothetical protein
MVLGRAGMIPWVGAWGEANVELYDVLIVSAIGRLYVSLIVRGETRRVQTCWRAIGGKLAVFLGSLCIATGIAGWRFGPDLFVAEVAPLLRLTSQVAAGMAIAVALRSPTEVTKAWRLLRAMGYLAAVSVGVSFVAWFLGMAFGEVQSGEEVTRWFGPVGDEVGFVLVFFALWEAAARQWSRAGLLGAAVLLTGTRGALMTLAVGVGALWVNAGGLLPLGRRRVALGMAVVVAVLAVVWVADPGQVRQRFLSSQMLGQGLAQRTETMWTALRMLADFPVLGVGFQGFRLLKDSYDHDARRLTSDGHVASNAANQYLQTAIDGGGVALAAFVAVMWRAVNVVSGQADGRWRVAAAASASWLWALLLGAQTVAWLLPSSVIGQLVWVVIGLAIAGRAAERYGGVWFRPAARRMEREVSRR